MRIKTISLVQLFFLSQKPLTKSRQRAAKQLARQINKDTGEKKSVKDLLGFSKFLYLRDPAFRARVNYFKLPVAK